MSIRQIKDKVEELPDSEKIIDQLSLSLKQHRNNRALFNEVISLNVLLSELKEKSIILENIVSFAYYLAVLKVTTISKDFRQTRSIISRFLNQKDTKLSFIISETFAFEDKINELEHKYCEFISLLSKEHALEDKLFSDTQVESENITKLKETASKQKIIIHNIGLTFSELAKQLLKNKEYKKYIKKR